MRALALDRATAGVVEALRDAGIPSLLLKGASTARWIYKDESVRTYADVDLLVPPEHLVDAESLLDGVGFRRIGFESIPHDWPKHAVALTNEQGLAIDLHRTFLGVGASDDRLWAEMNAGAESMELGGGRVRVPSEPGRAFVLAAHAAKDGALASQVRRDLDRATEVVADSVWREALAMAERLDAIPSFAAGLRRTERGSELADRLELPRTSTVQLALRDTPPPPLAVGIDWLLSGAGSHRFAVVARKLFPPREFMLAWSPLARRGTLGLALAYAGRPFWVISRAVPAYLAVRRARRSDRARPGSPP